jgi:hypothetical protein
MKKRKVTNLTKTTFEIFSKEVKSMNENENMTFSKCSGILRKSHKWEHKGGKEGAYFLRNSPRCSKCSAEDQDDCMQTTFKEAYPDQSYNNVTIYVNLKPKSEALNQTPKPEQENAEEINKEEVETSQPL